MTQSRNGGSGGSGGPAGSAGSTGPGGPSGSGGSGGSRGPGGPSGSGGSGGPAGSAGSTGPGSPSGSGGPAGSAGSTGPGTAKRASDPTARDPRESEGLDPGAFIGHEPEREASTIPGGVGPKDQRVSGVASQPGEPPREGGWSDPPAGHRDATGPGADTPANLREAGQNR